MDEKLKQAIQKDLSTLKSRITELEQDINDARAAGLEMAAQEQELRDFKQRYQRMVRVYGLSG
jgi:DNA repair exonuclease SbcCD ATPase subunit